MFVMTEPVSSSVSDSSDESKSDDSKSISEPVSDQLLENQETLIAQTKRIEKNISTSERRVNTVWEYTQSLIAVLVIITTCGGVIALSTSYDPSARMPPEWWTIVGLVVGFYFGRTRPPGVIRSGDIKSEPRLVLVSSDSLKKD